MTNWIKAINDFSVLVVGDIMLDEYVLGSVERVSPEAPVQVLSYRESFSRLGGAANVALNIRKLGAQVFLCGVSGADPEGELIKSLCRKEDIQTDLLVIDSTRNTTIKTRYMAGEQHLLRVDRESTEGITATLRNRIIEYIEHLLNFKPIDLVLFQDYDKGFLNGDLIQRIIELCKGKNIKISADPKHKNFMFFQNIDLFKPNLKEAAFALNEIPELLLDNKEHLIQSIQSKIASKHILVTLGADGLIMTDGNKIVEEDGIKIDVSDVCGAGDTVISIASLAMLSGLSMREICWWSNQAAAYCCTKPGVVALTLEDLTKIGALAQNP